MLLAIDTSTRLIGLALYDGARVISELTWTSQDHHTVELAPAILDLLTRSGAAITALTCLGVATGPGSFTGLRIGLALAKGLAAARRLPIIGVPTLDILAVAQPIRATPLIALLHAGRGRLAAAWYRAEGQAWKPVLTEDGAVAIEVLDIVALSEKIASPTLVCGELTEDERRFLARNRKNIILATPAQALRRPSFLAELAWQRWQAGQTDDPALLSPVYLHLGDPIPA